MQGIATLIVWIVFIGLLLVFGLAVWIGRGVKGKLIAIGIACVITSPILWPLATSFIEDARTSGLQAKVTPICNQELAQTPGPFIVDGFLDETGGLRSSDIQRFLTDGGMSFVEVKLASSGLLTGPENHAWKAERSEGFARLQLAESTTEGCYVPPTTRPENFFTSAPPVKPGTCLQVVYADRPSALYAISLDRSAARAGLSRWVLHDTRTASVVAGFTDALEGLNPTYVVPHLSMNPLDTCRPNGTHGYSTLMQRLQASKEARAKALERVMRSETLTIAGIPRTIDALSKLKEATPLPIIRSSDESFLGDRATLYGRRTWEASYKLAQRHGAWVAGNMLIRPSAGTLIQIKHDGLYGAWGTTGNQLIFVQSNSPGEGIAVFGVDFHGKAVWAAQLSKLTPWTGDVPLHFQPEGFELTEKELLVHGIYGHPVGEANRKAWTVHIPLSELNERVSANHK